MEYHRKVIEYFINQDTREFEDLASQIESGSYEKELSHLTNAQISLLVESVRNNEDLTKSQIDSLKKVNHIGAFILLAYHLE